MSKQLFRFKKRISRFLILPSIVGMTLISQFYGCKEDENLPPLEIYSIDPHQAEVGDTIRIIGQGFSPGFNYNHIYFTGGADTYSLPGSTTETLLVPVPDGALPGTVTINILDVETAQSPNTIEIQPPVITEVLPAEAWIGDTVVLRGSHFQLNKSRNNVKFGSSDADGLVVSATKTELKVIVPQGAFSGAVRVMGFAGPDFKIKPSVIDAMVPSHGVVGDTIVIQGKGLNASNVTFKPSLVATLLRDKNNSRNIYVIVPPGAVDGVLQVQCTINNQIINLETPQPFLVYPFIREFSPLSGSPGVPVTISGYNFSTVAAENVVSFNGTLATVTSASSTELVVEVPAGFSTGSVTVAVNGRTVTGPVFSVAEPGAPIIFSIAPRSGPVGSQVLITGRDFGTTTGANSVKFGGNVNAAITRASATQLVVSVPAGAQSGQITVTKDGKTGLGPSFTITADAVPFISSVEPASARRGETITIKGANFNKDAATFTVRTSADRLAFSILSIAPEQVVATVPPNIELGEHFLEIGQDGKFGNALAFQVSGTPVITGTNISEGIPGTTVTLTGIDFHPTESQNSVKFGDTPAVLVNPNDKDKTRITVYVPDLSAGIYSMTVTAFGKMSGGINFFVKPKTDPVRSVIYTEYDEKSPGHFNIVHRTNDPPSKALVYQTVVTAYTVNVLAVDPPNNRAYFVNEGGYDIWRVNLNGSNAGVIFPGASQAGATIYDLTLDTQHQKMYFTDALEAGTVYVGDLNGGEVQALVDYSTLGIFPEALSYLPETDRLYMCGGGVSGPDDVGVIEMAPDGSFVTLFTKGQGLVKPLDMKIDAAAQRIFILDDTSIKVGNLDGSGSLTTLTTRSQRIAGMAIDITAQYVYWMEVSAADPKKAVIRRIKYDHSTIPGTDPAASEEEVYADISTDPNATTAAGLAVNGENGSGSSQRSAFSLSSLKIKRRTK